MESKGKACSQSAAPGGEPKHCSYQSRIIKRTEMPWANRRYSAPGGKLGIDCRTSKRGDVDLRLCAVNLGLSVELSGSVSSRQ
jgi:hypothetical protein